jgi:hypothetical protein
MRILGPLVLLLLVLGFGGLVVVEGWHPVITLQPTSTAPDVVHLGATGICPAGYDQIPHLFKMRGHSYDGCLRQPMRLQLDYLLPDETMQMEIGSKDRQEFQVDPPGWDGSAPPGVR